MTKNVFALLQLKLGISIEIVININKKNTIYKYIMLKEFKQDVYRI